MILESGFDMIYSVGIIANQFPDWFTLAVDKEASITLYLCRSDK